MFSQKEEWEATELVFPKEFESADALLVSEVKMLLEFRKSQSDAENDDSCGQQQELPVALLKTLTYARKFSKYGNRETIAVVRGGLAKWSLHKYEAASLANLCPETVEEVKSLLPSLEGRFDDNDIRQMLDEIKINRSFQY